MISFTVKVIWVVGNFHYYSFLSFLKINSVQKRRLDLHETFRLRRGHWNFGTKVFPSILISQTTKVSQTSISFDFRPKFKLAFFAPINMIFFITEHLNFLCYQWRQKQKSTWKRLNWFSYGNLDRPNKSRVAISTDFFGFQPQLSTILSNRFLRISRSWLTAWNNSKKTFNTESWPFIQWVGIDTNQNWKSIQQVLSFQTSTSVPP